MADSINLEAVKDALRLAQRYLLETAQERPRLAAITVFIVFTLLATRLVTTVQFHAQRARTAKAVHPVPPPVPPFSVPYLGNGFYYLNLVPNIKRIFQSNPEMTAFTFHLFGSRHHVILAPSMVHQMANQKSLIPKFTLMPFIFRTVEKVWNDHDQVLRNMDQGRLAKVHSYLANMMHPTFLNVSVPALTRSLSNAAPDLITYSQSIVDQPPWERAAGVITTSPTEATAKFFTLIRHFSGALTTDIFFSPDLLHNNPDLITDLFLMDTRFEQFFAGIPSWLPANRAPAAARDRVVAAMREQILAFHRWDNGLDPGSQWSRVGETCGPMADRIRGCARDGDFDESLPESQRARKATLCNVAILWALHTNATGTIYWLLHYIYSDPQLLKDARAEIAPFVKIASSPDAFPGGIREKPRLEIDAPGLRSQAKLLLSAFHEVLRMETYSLTYKSVLADFTVSESAEDAAMHGRPGDPKTYAISKGDFIVVPHTLHQYDARYFPDPHKFDARRFWVPSGKAKNANNGTTEKKDADANNDNEKAVDARTLDPAHVEVSYLTAHPWGGGAQLCKGKKFAENEVLMIAAAILFLWDVVPVSMDYLGREKEVEWRHPGHATVNATARPARDVKVKVTRREGVW